MLRNRNLLSIRRCNAKIDAVWSVVKTWNKILWLTVAGTMCRLDMNLAVMDVMTVKTIMGW